MASAVNQPLKGAQLDAVGRAGVEAQETPTGGPAQQGVRQEPRQRSGAQSIKKAGTIHDSNPSGCEITSPSRNTN